ncbi:MAG TPA: hypothetical protein VNQ90_00565 [Chthoniobacteraceae bacterium]|nr:hypothetical protein [Chthoniobacteraceae bacterium]
MQTFLFPKVGYGVVAAVALLFSLIPLKASSLIVNWGGKYLASYAPFDIDEPTSAGGRTEYAYSDTVPINPGGPTFYGAFLLSNGDGSGVPAFDDNAFGLAPYGPAPGDRFKVAATAGASPLAMRGLFFFKKEDFAGAGSGPVTLDSQSSFRIELASAIGSTRRIYLSAYALVEGQWNWYLLNNPRGGGGEYTRSGLGTELWALYEPEGEEFLPAPPGTSAFKVSGAAFEDIGAVGVFFDLRQTEQGKTTTLYIESVQVVATVPEPSAIALSVMFAALGLASLRRRKAALLF